ncbi:translocation/assembly module TamB domain-containing protein [Candidatus Odyssella thessalonicensis]|uniref:translocation/assembly module TamB domain-containing protein n=1 Tax=Candidatus Odyssella thessalonicensis TaxID=84647 RepID=UPI000225B17B|nr:translocation/assembly module TamB domain-containing protein [Candidatus Odyssella thessalonicensis]
MRSILSYIFKFLGMTFLAVAMLLLILQIPTINTRVVQGIVNLIVPPEMYIRIRGIRGAFPFDITVDKVKIKDKHCRWLEIHGLKIDWQGVDILYGNLHFPQLTAKRLTFWRLPDLPPDPDPVKLPWLNVDDLHINSVECPFIFTGNFEFYGRVDSTANDHHHMQFDLRFSDNPEHVDRFTYDQTGITYLLKGKINRPLKHFARLSPETFSKIQTGQAILDVDIKGDTYFKMALGHVKGELINFRTLDNNLQTLLGTHPKLNLEAKADDQGNIKKAAGSVQLGLKKELSFHLTPKQNNSKENYNLHVHLKSRPHEGDLYGELKFKDNTIFLDQLHLTGMGCDVQGKLQYGKTITFQAQGSVYDLYPISSLVNYPTRGEANLDISYNHQDLMVKAWGKNIIMSAPKKTIEQFEVRSEIVQGQGPLSLAVHSGETTLNIDLTSKQWWQEIVIDNFILNQGKTKLAFVESPFAIKWEEKRISVPHAQIRFLDGQLNLNNVEYSASPRGEIILDKVTAKILNPLINNVVWQGDITGKLAFQDHPSKGYYAGCLKLVNFGTVSDLRKTHKLINLAINFSHSSRSLTIDTHLSDSAKESLHGKIVIDTHSYIPQHADVIKSTLAGSFDLSSLNSLIWWGDRLKGTLMIDHASQGTLSALNPTIKLHIKDGYYENAAIGTVLKGINGSLAFANQEFVIPELKGRDYRKGEFMVKGKANLHELLAPTLDIHVAFDKLMLVNTDQAIVSVSGKIDASTPQPHSHELKGKVLVNSALINLTELAHEPKTIRTFRTEEELHRKQTKKHTDLKTTLNLDIDIPKKLLIQGYGLRSEWKGNLKVLGPLNAPQIGGSINSLSGRLDIASKRLQLSPSSVSFQTVKGEIIPLLNIKTKKQVREYEAYIVLSGPSNNPKIEFISLPALPTEDVIALILFDKPIAEVTAAQSLQLATTMAAVKAGNFKGSAFDSLNQLLGVDDISLQKAETSEVMDDEKQSYSLTIGKQLSDKIYVGVEQGLQQEVGTKLKAKVDVTKNTKLEIETGTQNSAVAYGWEFRY